MSTPEQTRESQFGVILLLPLSYFEDADGIIVFPPLHVIVFAGSSQVHRQVRTRISMFGD
jgi:hypothetical protein